MVYLHMPVTAACKQPQSVAYTMPQPPAQSLRLLIPFFHSNEHQPVLEQVFGSVTSGVCKSRGRPRRSPLHNSQAGDYVACKACSSTWAPVGPLAPVAPAMPARPVAPFWPEAPVAPCGAKHSSEENVSAAHAKSDYIWDITTPLCQPSLSCKRPVRYLAEAHEYKHLAFKSREGHSDRGQYLLRHARCANRPLGASRSRSTCGCASNPNFMPTQGFQMH